METETTDWAAVAGAIEDQKEILTMLMSTGTHRYYSSLNEVFGDVQAIRAILDERRRIAMSNEPF